MRYMVESVFARDEAGVPYYAPVGVWVAGGDLDLVVRFLPGYPEEQALAEAVLPRMKAAGMRAMPSGFLEYHRDTLSAYRGSRGPIVTTESYPSTAACAAAVLADIRAGNIQ